MARATKTIRTSARRELGPAPKKRIGRPLGSKNRTKSASAAKAAPITRTTRAAPRKTSAAAVPKSSKAELEQQVVKLERTIARLRKQNTELKQASREEALEAAPAPVAKTRRAPKRAAASTTRRGGRAVTEPAAEAPAAKAAAKRTARGSTKPKPSRAAEPDVAQDDHEDKAAVEE